jgi:anti-sigma factor RsiW
MTMSNSLTNCPTGEELSAYHDGRFSGERLAMIQRHIADCPPCGLELSRLAALSGMFAATVRPGISQIARHRLHDKIDAAMERGLIRFGWSLSGIAASILLVSSAWLMHVGSNRQVTEAAPPWVGVAASSEAEAVVQDAKTPAAAFYLADASAGTSTADMP